MRRHITWITADYFLDTDVYVLEELVKYYDLDWYIIHQENNAYEYKDKIEEIENSANVKYIEISRHASDPRNFGVFLKLIKQIRRSKSKLVYTCLSFAPYLLPLLSIGFSKDKTILGIHNVHVPASGTHYTMNKLYNRFAINTFKYFQTFSKSQYDLLCDEVKGKGKEVREIPFMLKDYGKVKGQRRDSTITFLNFGNVREYKRIDVLIEAAQSVYEETKKKFRVIIAGKCDNWEKYQSLIKYPELFELHIERIENEIIPELFLEADYFVAPYQDIAQSGSSIVAMNYGVPIIASKLPAFEEYIDDKITGRLIQPADINSLKCVMKEIIITDNAGYLEMVKLLNEKRDHSFSVNAIIKQYKEYIDGIAEASENT